MANLAVKYGESMWRVKNQIDGRVEAFIVPDEESLEEWVFDGVCESPDGCRIEPDGTCEHGWPSWLIALGIM